jgi:hypothetical protein
MWLFSQKMMSNVGRSPNDTDFRMFGQQRMLMPISLKFGHSETTTQMILRNSLPINLSMLLSYSMILRTCPDNKNLILAIGGGIPKSLSI